MTDTVREIATAADLSTAVAALAPADGALILIGGADFAEPERLPGLRAFFDVLAGYCEQTDTAIVDGGTNSGVMRLIAEARCAIEGSFQLIGVTPRGALDRRTRAGKPIELARDHSLLLLVPGSRFGEETAWLFAAADHLAGGSAATLVVNGGQLTLEEAHLRMSAGHVVITVEGSGRAADELAADAGLRASGRLGVIPLGVDAAGLAAGLEASIEARERGLQR